MDGNRQMYLEDLVDPSMKTCVKTTVGLRKGRGGGQITPWYVNEELCSVMGGNWIILENNASRNLSSIQENLNQETTQ